MPAIETSTPGGPTYHCECKEKKWPPGPFPYCACPDCRPKSVPPVLMMGASHWTNTQVSWNCSGDHKEDRKLCRCKKCRKERKEEEDSEGERSDGSRCDLTDCLFHHHHHIDAKSKKKKENKKSHHHRRCLDCSHICCHKHGKKKTPCCGGCNSSCSHKCAYSYKHSSGGNPPLDGLGGCISGYHDPCVGHYCTGDPKTCWYCHETKEKEEEAEEKREREKRCHCHLHDGCPEGLALVGRHHCMTCLECGIDRQMGLD